MRKYFTITQANNSLVLVRPITLDITKKRKNMVIAKRIVKNLLCEESRWFGASISKRLSKEITHHLEELEQIGCYLKDFEHGIIDFPAILKGRVIFLTWNPTEKQIGYWHEIVHNADKKQKITLSHA